MPVGAVVINVPPQTIADAFATVSTAGSVSVNSTPVSGSTLAAGLVMVNVSEVDALSGIDAAPKALMRTGGPTTVIDAFEVLPAPPSMELTSTELFFTPALVP